MIETGDQLRTRIERVLDSDVRPYLQSHGGDLQVLSITPGAASSAVSVRMLGACRHCDLRVVTFAATIRAKLLRLDEVGAVNCVGIAQSEKRLDSIADFFAEPRAA